MQPTRWYDNPINLSYLLIGTPLFIGAIAVNQLGLETLQTPIGLTCSTLLLTGIVTGIELAIAAKVIQAI